eukprot:scaffold4023_cov31-Tisochrysis_lutea.AAC.2
MPLLMLGLALKQATPRGVPWLRLPAYPAIEVEARGALLHIVAWPCEWAEFFSRIDTTGTRASPSFSGRNMCPVDHGDSFDEEQSTLGDTWHGISGLLAGSGAAIGGTGFILDSSWMATRKAV